MNYTPQMLRRFDYLTMRTSSRDGQTRIAARLDLMAFEKEHGREVCQEMFKVLQARDAKRKGKK